MASQAYLRSAALHFGVSPGEVSMLAQWPVPPEEIPVALHLAGYSGVSAEAVLALRESGRSWADILMRYGLHAGIFTSELKARTSSSTRTSRAASGGSATAYAAYAERDSSSWRVIRLADAEVVVLVNLVFLSEHLEIPVDRVAMALLREGSPVAAHGVLLRTRGGSVGSP